jgi:hypothetical protein
MESYITAELLPLLADTLPLDATASASSAIRWAATAR